MIQIVIVLETIPFDPGRPDRANRVVHAAYRVPDGMKLAEAKRIVEEAFAGAESSIVLQRKGFDLVHWRVMDA